MQLSSEARVGVVVVLATLIFISIIIWIGAIRMDSGRYMRYYAYAIDSVGLSRKSEIKIAGVRVGYIDSITLESDRAAPVELNLMIAKEFTLYADARIMIRQDGMLGPKYIEVMPGTPGQPRIVMNGTFARACEQMRSFDDIYAKFDTFAVQIAQLSSALTAMSMKGSGVLDIIGQASMHIASMSATLDTALDHSVHKLDDFFQMADAIIRTLQHLQQVMIPTIGSAVNDTTSKVHQVIDTCAQSAHSVNAIIQKIEQGQGTLGKMINDDQAYCDIASMAGGMRGYFNTIGSLQLVFDNHFESMHCAAQNYQCEDAKGFFGLRIHPTETYFYVVQLISSDRNQHHKELTFNPILSDYQLNQNKAFHHSNIKLGLQLGKIFNSHMAVRVGLFENTAGCAIDFDIPMVPPYVRWVSSFEAYEFMGWKRRDEWRPHLKWLNRLFLMRNLYFTFGADDFISKRHTNLFFGGGLRFSDDDFKYLFGSLLGIVQS